MARVPPSRNPSSLEEKPVNPEANPTHEFLRQIARQVVLRLKAQSPVDERRGRRVSARRASFDARPDSE